MKHVKRGLGYLLYIIFFIVFVNIGVRMQEYLSLLSQKTFQPLPYLIYLVVYSILIGILIGVPALIKKLRVYNGNWKIDWVKLIAMGLPTFLMSTLIISYWVTPLRFIPLGFLFQNNTFFMVNGIMFGYSITYSIKNAEANK